MSLYDMSAELSSDYQVQESKLINHPEYAHPVLITRYGWAKRGRETQWIGVKIEQALKEKSNAV